MTGVLSSRGHRRFSNTCATRSSLRVPSATTNTLLRQVTGCKQLFNVQFDGVAVGLGLRFGTRDLSAPIEY
jgi:hypothetical protein